MSIQVKSINKSYGDIQVLHDISFNCESGETLVLLGPSGAGKSSLLRVLNLLEIADNGELDIANEQFDFASQIQEKQGLKLRRKVGMVFQQYNLWPHMTVLENLIEAPTKVAGLDKQEAIKQAQAVLTTLQLADKADAWPLQLSGGQQQRVALARAIVREPRMFLMDEPLSNLDAKLRVSMRALLKNLHHEFQRTTVYVTHDQIEAMTLADRVAVLYQGKIQQLDTPKEIYNNPASLFVARFIGSPGMNFIKGSLSAGTFSGVSCSVEGFNTSDNAAVTLGVRPEDVALCPVEESNLYGDVYSVEMTGECTLITVQVDEHYVICRTDKHCTVGMGDRVGFKFNLDHTYLFDTESEQRIYREQATSCIQAA